MRKLFLILALLLLAGQLIAQASRTFTLTSNAPIRMAFGKDTAYYMIEIQSIDGGGTAWVLNRSALGIEVPVFVREAGTKTDLDKISISGGVIKRFYVLSNAISLLKIVYTGTGANVIIWGFTKSNSGWSIEPIDAIQPDASKLRVDVIGTDTVFVNNFTSSSGKDTVVVKKLVNDTVYVRNNITVDPPTVDTIKYLKNGKIDVVGIDTAFISNFPASADNDKDTAIQSDASKLRMTKVGTDTTFISNPVSSVTVNNSSLTVAQSNAANLRADVIGIDTSFISNSSLPVTGTFWQATQPISGTVTVQQSDANSLRVKNVGTDTNIIANLYSVVGDTVTITALPVLTDKSTNANNNVIGNVSLGNSQGKTNVMKTGALVTTATTADQVILTYTVTAGKTFYLLYFNVMVRLTTYAATATNFGLASLENPSGTKLYTRLNAHSGIINDTPISFDEPIPISAGTVIRIVCTPGATTSFTWQANLGGYEK